MPASAITMGGTADHDGAEWATTMGETCTRRAGCAAPFQDLARQAQVHDVVTRAISGHATERMQRHYSTARREEIRDAVGKVVSLATARARRTAQKRSVR
jgi:hypothetical protein